jgi:hypothetical protein
VIKYRVIHIHVVARRWVGIDLTEVTILAIATQNLGLRPVKTRFSISDYLPRRIGRQSVLGHAFLVCVGGRHVPGHVVHLGGHEALWDLPRMGMPSY